MTRPGDVYVRRDGSPGAIKVVGVDDASGAVLIADAAEFGPVMGVDPAGIARHYTLQQPAAAQHASGGWETPIEDVIAG